MSEYIEGGNFASYILRHAETQPDALALVIPTSWDGDAGQILKSGSLIAASRNVPARLMTGFQKLGLQAGDRVIVLFPLSVDLYATVVALWALGVAVVFIDTGMPPQKIKQAMETANAKSHCLHSQASKVSISPLAALQNQTQDYPRETGPYA